MPNSPRTPVSRVVYTLGPQLAMRPRTHPSPPRRSPVNRQPRFNNKSSSNNKAAIKIQAALRGWLARHKFLPKNKFRTVVNPNGTVLVAIKPTRLGASVAKKAANKKQYNRYLNRLRGL